MAEEKKKKMSHYYSSTKKRRGRRFRKGGKKGAAASISFNAGKKEGKVPTPTSMKEKGKKERIREERDVAYHPFLSQKEKKESDFLSPPRGRKKRGNGQIGEENLRSCLQKEKKNGHELHRRRRKKKRKGKEGLGTEEGYCHAEDKERGGKGKKEHRSPFSTSGERKRKKGQVEKNQGGAHYPF